MPQKRRGRQPSYLRLGWTVAKVVLCTSALVRCSAASNTIPPPRQAAHLSSSGFRVLLDFGSKSTYGSGPSALIAVNGTLYGTTGAGAQSTSGSCCGTVFALTPRGAITILHTFAGGADGGFPEAPLTAVGDTLYGTTFGDGFYAASTLFSMRTDGSHYRILHTFTGYSDGLGPDAQLLALNGVLYGATEFGGTSTNGGTVFRLRISDSREKILHYFVGGTDGE